MAGIFNSESSRRRGRRRRALVRAGRPRPSESASAAGRASAPPPAGLSGNRAQRRGTTAPGCILSSVACEQSHTLRPCSISRRLKRPHSLLRVESAQVRLHLLRIRGSRRARGGGSPAARGCPRAGRAGRGRRSGRRWRSFGPTPGRAVSSLISREAAGMQLDEGAGHPDQMSGLRVEETRRADEDNHLLRIGGRQRLCIRKSGEEGRRDHVDPLVGGLGREDRRHQQLERVRNLRAHSCLAVPG